MQVIHALKSRELILQLLEQWNQLRRETVQHARIKNTDLPHRYLVPKRFYDAMETHRHPERNSAVFIPKQELSHVLSPGGLTRRRSKVTELNPRKRSTVPDTTKCVTTDSRLDDSYPEDESYEPNPKSVIDDDDDESEFNSAQKKACAKSIDRKKSLQIIEASSVDEEGTANVDEVLSCDNQPVTVAAVCKMVPTRLITRFWQH